MTNEEYYKLIEDKLKTNPILSFTIAYKDIDKVTEDDYKMIRMNWLGASDSSKLLDVNPFPNGSKDDLIHEKVFNESDDSIGKKASVRMGKDIEDIILGKIRDYVTKENCTLNIVKIEKPTDMYGNVETGLGINYDSLAVDKENNVFPFELKAVTKYGRKYYDFTSSMFYQKDGEWQEPREIEDIPDITSDYTTIAHTYGIPVYYYTQLQQQMLGANSEVGYLGVLDVDNWDVHIFKVYANEKLWSKLIRESKDASREIRTRQALLKQREGK